ncbi:hypothetical protein [uncultured Tenacibaculum sp.]|uniref:hypothetical protein n=1 Tax=uncultured Tenacibaculum sp. TaxID=174713 RepID=UPI002611B756|nr:hypothetical protein [uncultured Tenacibaculum sp.]
MKRLFFITVFSAILGCNAQKKVDLSTTDVNMNYIFSSMYSTQPLHKELFNNSLFLSVYKFSDSKLSKGKMISESDEFMSSYMVSVTPDGDRYTGSKLYKIEGVFNPKIIKVEEDKYPFFTIKVEHGLKSDRKTESFQFKGE